jgi:hypothetical protein
LTRYARLSPVQLTSSGLDIQPTVSPFRTLAVITVTTALCACVPPWHIVDRLPVDQSPILAPMLTTDEQRRKFDSMTIYPEGEDLSRPYKELSKVYGAVRWQGAPTTREAQLNQALHDLKVSAATLLADAVIDVSCRFGPRPGGPPHSTAEVCSGRAVLFQ